MFLISLIAFCIIIGVVVTIHEGDHFLASKYFNVKVYSFSVGMGPVLFSRKKGETSYEIRAFPIGGFVKPLSLDMDEAKTLSDKERARALDAQARWKRIIIYLAGPFANLILAWVCWSIVGMTGVADFSLNMGNPPPQTQAAQMGIAEGDRIVAVNGRPVMGYSETNTLLMNELGEEITFRFERHNGIFERTVSLHGMTLSDVAKWPILAKLGFVPELKTPIIRNVLPNSPAEKAGLEGQERVWAINGEAMETVNQAVNTIREAGGREITLTVSPFEEPNEREDVVVTPRQADGGRWQIGVNLSGMPEVIEVKYNPLETVVNSYQRVVMFLELNAQAIRAMISGTADTREMVQGPVGMASVAGKAAVAGFSTFLDTIGIFSLAIGFMNLIPIPMLDGGEVMVLAVESVIRRDLPQKLRDVLKMTGLFIVLALMVFALTNDLAKLL